MGRFVERSLLLVVFVVQLWMLHEIRVLRSDRQSLVKETSDVESIVLKPSYESKDSLFGQGMVAPMNMEDVMEGMERAIKRMMHGPPSRMLPRHHGSLSDVSPYMDIRDGGARYLFTFSMPDMQPDRLGVIVDGQVMTLQVFCNTPNRQGRQKLYERQLLLPGPVRLDHSMATFTNGILRVTLPKGDATSEGHSARHRLY